LRRNDAAIATGAGITKENRCTAGSPIPLLSLETYAFSFNLGSSDIIIITIDPIITAYIPKRFSGQSPSSHWVSKIKFLIAHEKLNAAISRLARLAHTAGIRKSKIQIAENVTWSMPGRPYRVGAVLRPVRVALMESM